MTQADVVLISKPLGPPWNDGSKTLVRELARALPRSSPTIRYAVMVPAGASPPAERLVAVPVSQGRGQNARIFSKLLNPWLGRAYHFFFAPHAKAVAAARLACVLSGSRAIQTLCSMPAELDQARELCFAKRVVTVSRWGRDRLVDHGVDPEKILWIPPPLAPVPEPGEARRVAARRQVGAGKHPIVLFAGDAEPGGGLSTLIRAVPRIVRRARARIVIACRQKGGRSQSELDRARRSLAAAGTEGDVCFAGEVADFPALLAESSVCLLPASSLHAKVDYPYFLLEAMSLGIPTVVCSGTPPEELALDGAAVAIAPGAHEELGAVVAELLGDPSRSDELGRSGRRWVESSCAPTEVAARYAALHWEILGNHC